jgi:hypothetical protein
MRRWRCRASFHWDRARFPRRVFQLELLQQSILAPLAVQGGAAAVQRGFYVTITATTLSRLHPFIRRGHGFRRLILSDLKKGIRSGQGFRSLSDSLHFSLNKRKSP